MRKARRVAKGDSEYHVCDGQAFVGVVRLVNSKYQALAPDGTLLGVFDQLWTAVARLPAAPDEKAEARQRPGPDADQPDEPVHQEGSRT
jgi:hypothetical protein